MTAGSDRARVRRAPRRGVDDSEVVEGILADGVVCHVGIEIDGQPFVIPMAYAPDGVDRLLIHGSPRSRLVRALADGAPGCVTVTHLDGVVFSRSGFHSSMNYRSVVAFGTAREIDDPDEKAAALDRLVDHLIPGRSGEVRPPEPGELEATSILAFTIEEASAKVRSGPPDDPAGDLDLPIWAGTIPLRTVAGRPQPAPDLDASIPVPHSVERYRPPAGNAEDGSP